MQVLSKDTVQVAPALSPAWPAEGLLAQSEAKVRSLSTADASPTWLDRGRIPCLDGLRALSILLVFVEHILTTGGYARGAGRLFHPIGNMGVLGVDVFFTISGFLITLLLVREWEKFGTISLKGFYTRRFLRLMPAMGVFLLTI